MWKAGIIPFSVESGGKMITAPVDKKVSRRNGF